MVEGREPIDHQEIEGKDYETVKAAFIQAAHTLDVDTIRQSLEGEFRQDISLMLLHAFRWMFENPNTTAEHVRLLISYSQEKGESFRISVLEDAIKKASPDMIKIIFTELVSPGTPLPSKLLDKAKKRLGEEVYASIFLQPETSEMITEDQFISMLPNFEDFDQVRAALAKLGTISKRVTQEIIRFDNYMVNSIVFDYLVENGIDPDEHSDFVAWLVENGADEWQGTIQILKEEKNI